MKTVSTINKVNKVVTIKDASKGRDKNLFFFSFFYNFFSIFFSTARGQAIFHILTAIVILTFLCHFHSLTDRRTDPHIERDGQTLI